MALTAYFRLLRAGYVLAREGAFSILDAQPVPSRLRFAISAARLIERPEVRRTGRVERLKRALDRLGPTYVKFGQTLATRPDIVGADIALDLAVLQDSMAPFDPALVPQILAEALGERAKDLHELSPPIAAASIAQVHKAVLVDQLGRRQAVAVKILRPGVAQRFMDDIESYYAAARFAERMISTTRRLRPVEVVRTLDRSAKLELDLRLEGASISEFAQNIRNDLGLVVPQVSWDHTAQNVLTTSWVEGVPIRDLAALDAALIDRRRLAENLLQSFLRHAIRDGFFHADMHPGNLFADPKTGNVVVVDFGIMGRLSKRERKFLADIVYGFIRRDYHLVAQRHFDIGYVPPDQSIDDFSLALRSIGEPLHGRRANDISMGRVLGQLFAVTELFNMQTRPELVLLQKNMVLVEGVARALDPDLDIWTVAEPVVRDWLQREEGPLGRLEDLRDRAEVFTDTLGRVPSLIKRAEVALDDYDADKANNRPWISRGMALFAFWLFVITCFVFLWRLIG